jgi:uncharacterized protein (TIGR00251 family)
MDRCTLYVKVVPNAKRAGVAGMLGERVKLRVAQPPEDGKANQAVCALLATELNIKITAVQITAGLSAREKTVQIDGLTFEEVMRILRECKERSAK